MNDAKVRFGLIGCGSITKKHITALSRLEEAELAAVCDLDPEAAKAMGEEAGVPYYSDPRTMGEREGFDIYSILTPSGTHADVLLSLVDMGRDFVVEKPLALRIEDADEMIRACDKHGRRIFVVQQNRCNKAIVKLKQAIDQGRFGRMVMGTVRVRWCRRQEYYNVKPWRGTWAQDGGALTNQASHSIDMLSWLLGDVQDVMSMTATRLARIEAEDTGVAILRFVNGALGVVEATTATRPKDLEGSISVLGERGAVEVGGFYMNKLRTWQFEDERPEDATIMEECGDNPSLWAWNHTEFLRDVVASFSNGSRGLVDGLEGRKSLELINAIYESAETGKRVALRFQPRFCRLGMPEGGRG